MNENLTIRYLILLVSAHELDLDESRIYEITLSILSDSLDKIPGNGLVSQKEIELFIEENIAKDDFLYLLLQAYPSVGAIMLDELYVRKKDLLLNKLKKEISNSDKKDIAHYLYTAIINNDFETFNKYWISYT